MQIGTKIKQEFSLVQSLSRVRFLATAWTAAYQAPLSMGFSRQEYWSGGHCLLRKSPTIIVLLLISPFLLVSICLTYCGASMLGAYIFIIVISSSWIDHYVCPSLSLFTAFVLKSILSDMSIATPAFLGLYLHGISFSRSFSLYVSLVSRWVSCRQHI